MISIAQLNANVFLGLGEPDAAICAITDIHYAVRNAVTLRTRQVRQADKNQPLSVTDEFTPTASPYETTSLISFGEEAFLEIQVGNRWKPVRVVNKAFLEDYYDRGISAAAFYGTEDRKRYVEFAYDLSSNSTEVYRIWYDKDAVDVSLSGTEETGVLFPDSLAPMIELDAQQTLIPRLKMKLAEMIEDEDGRKIVAMRIQALDGIYAQNAFELTSKWEPSFRVWKNRNKTAQNQARLPNKSGKALYGR